MNTSPAGKQSWGIYKPGRKAELGDISPAGKQSRRRYKSGRKAEWEEICRRASEADTAMKF